MTCAVCGQPLTRGFHMIDSERDACEACGSRAFALARATGRLGFGCTIPTDVWRELGGALA